MPNRYRYYRPYSYWRPYYGDGHEPWNRPSPGDYGAADQLNRQQLSWLVVLTRGKTRYPRYPAAFGRLELAQLAINERI